MVAEAVVAEAVVAEAAAVSLRALLASDSMPQEKTLFHNCKVRYDCERQEYVPLRPLPNATEYNTLAAVLRLRSDGDSFEFEQRLAVRHAVSSKFGVPQFLVSISEVAMSPQYVDIVVHVGPGNVSTCHEIDCEAVLRPDLDTEARLLALSGPFAGAQELQLPVCKLCAIQNLLQFASAGALDDPFSCDRECTEGFFQFLGFENVPCQQHSSPQCLPGQFLQAGTATTDSECVACSTCEGQMFVAVCSGTTDSVCEPCPDAVAYQHWVGSDCSPACKEGFMWNMETHECEFCAQTLCAPGWRTPKLPHNCSHCVLCPQLPSHAHWSVQNDRFDCMWTCDDAYELSNMTCVAQTLEVMQLLAAPEPVCAAGLISVNLSCVSCFEAQAMGIVQQNELPLPADNNTKWQWLYACKWQCLHSRGYWELRSVSGGYWECTSLHTHSVMLRGTDMSWALPPEANTRRLAGVESSSVVIVVLVLVAMPVLLCLCAVLICIFKYCSRSTVTDFEQEPLLAV